MVMAAQTQGSRWFTVRKLQLFAKEIKAAAWKAGSVTDTRLKSAIYRVHISFFMVSWTLCSSILTTIHQQKG